MSHHEIEPLDDELRAMLAPERAREAPPDDALDRVARRAALTVGGGSGGGSGGGPARPGTGARGASRLLSRPLAMGVAGFLLGGVTGAAVHAAFTRPPPLPRAITAPPLVAAPPATSTSFAAPEPTAAAPAQDPAPPATVAAPPARERPSAAARPSAAPSGAARDPSLEEELTLIAMARTAVLRGNRDRALDALREHARKYPAGQLATEREILLRQVGARGESDPR